MRKTWEMKKVATINGTEIDLMPTKGMKVEAERYREWKSEGESGGTEVAARRATQILSGNELSADVVIAMAAWFARHEVDKQGEGFSPGEDGYPSNGRVAEMLAKCGQRGRQIESKIFVTYQCLKILQRGQNQMS